MALLSDPAILALVVLLLLLLLAAVVLAIAFRSARRNLREARRRMQDMVDLSEDMVTIRLRRLERDIRLLELEHGRGRAPSDLAGRAPKAR